MKPDFRQGDGGIVILQKTANDIKLFRRNLRRYRRASTSAKIFRKDADVEVRLVEVNYFKKGCPGWRANRGPFSLVSLV